MVASGRGSSDTRNIKDGIGEKEIHGAVRKTDVKKRTRKEERSRRKREEEIER
jgi:hypothetical protein